MDVDDDEEEVTGEPQKLSATEALKKRLKEQEARKELRQVQGGSRGGRMTMGSEVTQFHFIILFHLIIIGFVNIGKLNSAKPA